MIVVDTHAVIWLTQGRSRLSETAIGALTESRNAGITLHEIAKLVSTRRVTINAPLTMYLKFLEALFRVMPIDGQIAERAVQFGPAYPNYLADRLIGATAVVHGARLVTKDEKIRQSGEVDCIW